MWPLLWTAALASASAPASGAPYQASATVTFAGGQAVQVRGPKGSYDVRYTLETVQTAPGGSLKALHWCWEFTKFWSCQVQLVWPDGRQPFLNKGSVRQLGFTPDGRWLVGMGDNTLRLWNLTRPDDVPRTKVLNMRFLRQLQVSARHLCITGDRDGSAVYNVLSWPDLRLTRQREVRLVKEIRETVVEGKTTTESLRFERVGTFTPPVCP